MERKSQNSSLVHFGTHYKSLDTKGMRAHTHMHTRTGSRTHIHTHKLTHTLVNVLRRHTMSITMKTWVFDF